LPGPKRKGNLILRYTCKVRDFAVHIQAAGFAQSAVLAAPLLVTTGYASLDLAAGIGRGSWSADPYVKNAFDGRGQQDRFLPCGLSTCTQLIVIPIVARIAGISFRQKF
jgi:iron complex outermembrane recepter protein